MLQLNENIIGFPTQNNNLSENNLEKINERLNTYSSFILLFIIPVIFILLKININDYPFENRFAIVILIVILIAEIKELIKHRKEIDSINRFLTLYGWEKESYDYHSKYIFFSSNLPLIGLIGIEYLSIIHLGLQAASDVFPLIIYSYLLGSYGSIYSRYVVTRSPRILIYCFIIIALLMNLANINYYIIYIFNILIWSYMNITNKSQQNH